MIDIKSVQEFPECVNHQAESVYTQDESVYSWYSQLGLQHTQTLNFDIILHEIMYKTSKVKFELKAYKIV